LRVPANASPHAPVNPVTAAKSTSSRLPACQTTPAPSADTTIFGRDMVFT
jgi:hypothetical protein